MTVCYVGLGSNLDRPDHQVRSAITALRRLPQTRLLRHSSFYSSKPLGGIPQPDYINAVAMLSSQLPAQELLDELFKIEQIHGRLRGERWGPRTLDLDLLLYGNQIINQPGLQVPHPGIGERCFVLIPLLELGCYEVPGLGDIRHTGEDCHDQLIKLGEDLQKERV